MLRTCTAAAVLVGCAGSPNTHRGTPNVVTEDPAASVRAFLGEQYGSVVHGFDAWADMNLPDALFLSSGFDGVSRGREVARERLHRAFGSVFDGGGTVTMTSKGAPHIGVAPGGDAAWVMDEVDFVISPKSGPPDGGVLRVNEVLARQGGRWKIAASHWSLAFDDEAVLAGVRAGTWKHPEDMGDAIAPGAEPVVAAFREMVHRSAIGRQVDDAPGVVLLGSGANEYFVGAAQIRTTFDKDTEKPAALVGGVRAALTPSGDVGWAASNVDIAVGDAVMPLRVMAVYARSRSDGGWKLVQAHLAATRSD